MSVCLSLVALPAAGLHLIPVASVPTDLWFDSHDGFEIEGDRLYVATGEGGFSAYEVATGTLQNTVAPPPTPQALTKAWSDFDTLAVADERVIVGARFRDSGGAIRPIAYVYDTNTSATPWVLAGDKDTVGGRLVGLATDGRYVASVGLVDSSIDGISTSRRQQVSVLDLETGQVQQLVDVPEQAYDALLSVAIDDGLVVVGGYRELGQDRVAAFDAASGEKLRSWVSPRDLDTSFGSHVAVRGSSVFIGDSGERRPAYWWESGVEVPGSDPHFASDLIDGDGDLGGGSGEGRNAAIYRFDLNESGATQSLLVSTLVADERWRAGEPSGLGIAMEVLGEWVFVGGGDQDGDGLSAGITAINTRSGWASGDLVEQIEELDEAYSMTTSGGYVAIHGLYRDASAARSQRIAIFRVVPEPATAALFGAFLAMAGRRRG
ncbi:MAG: hypothetical protein AAF805_08045 [Planctomycetota bacterium]